MAEFSDDELNPQHNPENDKTSPYRLIENPQPPSTPPHQGCKTKNLFKFQKVQNYSFHAKYQ